MSALEVVELDRGKAHMLPYAPAIRVSAASDRLFLSGAVSIDDDEYPTDIVEQVRRVMRRHTAVLEANGMGWSNVIHVFEFLTDMRDTVAVHTTMAEFFDDPSWKPANTLIGVNALAKAGARFELDVIAAQGPDAAPTLNSAFWMSGATAIPLYHMHPHIEQECVLPDDIAEQTRRVLTTFDEVLDFTGFTWSEVQKGSLFLTDLRDLDAVQAAVAAHLGESTAPMSYVGINALSAPGARLELEIVAGPVLASTGAVPQGAIAPQAAGAPAVRVPAGAQLVFLPVAQPRSGSVPGELAAQVDETLDAVAALLAEHELSWQAVVKVLIHLVDARDAAAVTTAIAARCGGWQPAVTIIQADNLPVVGARVQLDVIAAG